MFAYQLISPDLFPLKRSDSNETASMFFEDCGLNLLPVIENGIIVGWMNKEIAESRYNETCGDSMLPVNPLWELPHYSHLFELISRFFETSVSVIAITDAEGRFMGLIKSADTGMNWQVNTALIQPGASLVLEMDFVNYSPAELSRLAESNNIRILHLMLEPAHDDSGKVFVSLKLNKEDVSYLISSYERFGYQLVYSSSLQNENHSLIDRYNWLMKYIQE